MTSPPDSALTEAERAAFLQSIARVRSASGRALRAAQTHAVQGAAAHGTGPHDAHMLVVGFHVS